MTNSFVQGALAGYAIAIPIGAICVIVIETALRSGFWQGVAAASGAATADLIYATVAATLGTFVAVYLEPIAPLLKWVSASFLVVLGSYGLWKAWQARNAEDKVSVKPSRQSRLRTYLTLLGLTILNPATIAYFAALILGGSVGLKPSFEEKAAFVIGAFLASLSWQVLLAATGALAHRHLPHTFRELTSLVGNAIIIALGVKILY